MCLTHRLQFLVTDMHVNYFFHWFLCSVFFIEDYEGEGFLWNCSDKIHQPVLVNMRLCLSFCHFSGVIPFCMLRLLEMYSGVTLKVIRGFVWIL